MILNEAYIDDIDKSQKEDYNGEKIYRVIGLTIEDGRSQMYTIGIGSRVEGEEDENSFEPAIRSARYTTEESFLFKSEAVAQKFFREYKIKYGSETDFNLKKFHVSEYNPFHEILYLIPIHSPIGDAYVCEQKVEKKSYEKDDEE